MKYLSVLVFGALFAANASAQSDFKAFMKAMVPKVQKAFEKKDVGFFDSISAPDFVDKTGGKTTNRKDAMKEMKESMSKMGPIKLTMTLMSAEASGKVGHAVTAGMATFTMPAGKDGKAHVMGSAFTEHQTWVRTGSTWKLQVLEETMGATTIDGKPMGQMKGGH